VRFAAGGFQLGIGLVLLSLGRKAGTDAVRRNVPVVSVVPGARGGELLGWLLVHHYRSLRTSPNLSLRYSHGTGASERDNRAAEDAAALPRRLPMNLVDQQWQGGWVGARLAGLPRPSGGADAGPAAPQAPP
jgi:hypothetical protein